MKKISVFLVLLCLTVFSVTAFALPLERGDVDGSGKVTAADARKTLRFSAQLEEATDEQKAAADVDGDGDVTAVDARIILRVAAEIDVFPALPETPTENGEENNAKPDEPTTVNPTTEPTTAEKSDESEVNEPEETTVAPEPDPSGDLEYPKDLQQLLSGSYYLYGVASDEQNGDVYLAVIVDGDALLTVASLDMIDIGFLAPSGSDKIYLVNVYRDTITEITEDSIMGSLLGDDAISAEDFQFLRDDMEMPETVPVVTYLPEADMNCYTFTYDDGSYVCFYLAGDDLVKIEGYDEQGNLFTDLDVYAVMKVLFPEMLTLDYYEIQTNSEFVTTYIEDISSLYDPSYDPDNIWDKEYYYDEYWSDGIDWYSVEAVTLSPEDELPDGIDLIASYRYMSGVAQLSEGPYTVEYEDGVTDEFYFLNFYEYRFWTDGESVRMDVVTEFDESLTWIVTKKTDLLGREKDVVYLVSPENGIYTEVNTTVSGLPDMSGMPYDLDLLAITSPDDFTEVTLKTATDEEGKEHVLLTYRYEDGSASEVLLVDGQAFRQRILREDGTEMEVLRFDEVSQEPVDAAVFSVKGLRKVLMTTFWITVNGVW